MLIAKLHIGPNKRTIEGTITRDWTIRAGESVVVRRVQGTDLYELIVLSVCKIDATADTIKAFSCLPSGELSAGTDGKLVGTGKSTKTRKAKAR